MKTVTLILCLIFLQLFNLNAQIINWANCYGGSSNDVAMSIQQTTDGGYIVAGFTDSNDGDVTGNHGSYDYWVVKLNTAGTLEWQKCLGGSGYDEARSIQQTTDGGYIVAGFTDSNDGDVTGNHGGSDYWIVKLNTSGTLVWQKCLGGSSNESAWSIYQTTDGGYIVAGRSLSNDGNVTGNHGGLDYWVVKLNTAGTLQWQKCLGGSNDDEARSIQQTTDGGYIVAGFTDSNDGDVTGFQGIDDYWVVKLDTAGTLQWQKCLGGTSNDEAWSIKQTTDSAYIVTGRTTSNDGDVTGNHGSYDIWTVSLCVPRILEIEIGDTTYCDSTELTAIGNFVEYLWSTSDTTQTITISDGGIYSVIGYAESGCPTEDTIDAPYPAEPYPLLICMVTLDTATEKNVIVYEPLLNVGIDSVLFYRLNNVTSEYEWIGSININDLSIFVDNESVPSQQNYQYKIATRDTCDNIGELSAKHQTILLQASLGINNEINLFWNPYIGFDYPNFGIYRSLDGGEYILIANVPNNIYTFIDTYPPSGIKKYQIRVDKDPPCNPQMESYLFVGSNPVTIVPVAVKNNEFDDFKIYPNPFKTNLIIERPFSDKYINIDLMDVYSRVLETYVIKSRETSITLSVNYLSPGIYFLRFNGVFRKLIVKK